MLDMMNQGLREATQLTGSGRLMEATAAIQRMLKGAPASYPVPGPVPGPAPTSPPVRGRREPPTIDGYAEPAGNAEPSGPVADALRAFRTRVPLGDLVRGARAKPTTPAAAVPDGARFLTGTFANEAGSRSYKLYVPSGYSAGTPVPLVVMLHGCTQDPDDFAAGTRMNEVAERTGVLVAYPAQSQSANMQKCWNWFSVADQARDAGEPSLIAGITRQIMADYSVDPARVFVAGLSAGGAAASVMGHAYPDLFAAIGVHSGLAGGAAHDMPSAFAAMRQGAGGRRGSLVVPTIVFHGDRDPTVHPRNGDAVVAQSTAATVTRARTEDGQVPGGRGYVRTVHVGADDRTIAEHWLVRGGAHAWSGGSAGGSYTDPQGPDASAEMVRFFLEVAAA